MQTLFKISIHLFIIYWTSCKNKIEKIIKFQLIQIHTVKDYFQIFVLLAKVWVTHVEALKLT